MRDIPALLSELNRPPMEDDSTVLVLQRASGWIAFMAGSLLAMVAATPGSLIAGAGVLSVIVGLIPTVLWVSTAADHALLWLATRDYMGGGR